MLTVCVCVCVLGHTQPVLHYFTPTTHSSVPLLRPHLRRATDGRLKHPSNNPITTTLKVGVTRCLRKLHCEERRDDRGSILLHTVGVYLVTLNPTRSANCFRGTRSPVGTGLLPCQPEETKLKRKCMYAYYDLLL